MVRSLLQIEKELKSVSACRQRQVRVAAMMIAHYVDRIEQIQLEIYKEAERIASCLPNLPIIDWVENVVVTVDEAGKVTIEAIPENLKREREERERGSRWGRLKKWLRGFGQMRKK